MQYVFKFLSLGRKFLAVGSCPVHCAPWLRLLKSLFPRNLERVQGATCIQAEDRASHFAANMFDSDTPTVFSFNTVWFNDIYDNYFIPELSSARCFHVFSPNEPLPAYLRYLYFRRTIVSFFFPLPGDFFPDHPFTMKPASQQASKARQASRAGKQAS